MSETLHDIVREVVAGYADPAAPLELDSLSTVQLAEELEERFDFVAKAADLTPETFSSVDRIAAWVERSRG